MVKRFAPAAERNKNPILEVLCRVLPESGLVLEIASGTGQHAAYFASALRHLVWQPSDVSPAALQSIAAHVRESGLDNLRPPVSLDVFALPWPVQRTSAVLCVNMIHIAPWEATVALFDGASQTVPVGGVLVTYGPYKFGGRHTADSNFSFDRSLRAQDPRWGVRDVDELGSLGDERGFTLEERVAMPANNYTLVWRRGTTSEAALT